MAKHFDVAVSGGAMAGLTAALAFAREGHSVAVISPRPGETDRRTTALLASSVAYLERLGVWEAVKLQTARLAAIRIIDATNRLLRAPELTFHSSEIGLEAFGYNVANHVLVPALQAAAAATGKVEFIEGSVVGATFGETAQQLMLDNGEDISASLVIGADGRNSAIRRLAGIGERNWSYPQTALVLDFQHQHPHDDASTEFHTPEGPFTFVPLSGRTCGLVWVMQPQKAEARRQLPVEELERQIEAQMHSALGKVTIASSVQAWPMSGLIAARFGKGGVALVGEAAHVFPPIGAQGFNLGIRDIEAVASLAAGKSGVALASLGERYSARRAADIHVRTASIDLMNRSLLSAFLPVQIARTAGLHALSALGPLRRLAMREGVAPGMQWSRFAERFRPAR